jgi:hypothetical protein
MPVPSSRISSVRHVGKSLLIAFMGTGLIFFFLMMAAVPTMALLTRLSGDVTKTSVVVNPALFLRTYGLPLAVVAFGALFGVSEYRFRAHSRDRLPVQTNR